MIIRFCKICGEPFQTIHHSTRKYCSQKCRTNKADKDNILAQCGRCGKWFLYDRTFGPKRVKCICGKIMIMDMEILEKLGII